VVCVIITAIVVLKSYDSAFVTRNAVAQTHSETQKYDNQTPTSQQADVQLIIDENETPFLAKFRKLYESEESSHKLSITISTYLSCFSEDHRDRYTVLCTKKDVDKIKELAAQGDYFSLSVLAFVENHSEEKRWTEQALTMREPVTSLMVAGRYYSIKTKKYDPKKAENILMSIANSYPLISSTELMDFYKHRNINRIEDFCKTAERTYRDFGIFAITKYFVYDEPEGKDTMFDDCNLFGMGGRKDDILKILNTNEARLVLGYRYVAQKRYENARDIFENLFKENDPLLSINAGTCLGIMYYYGISYPIDKKKGYEMLKESSDKGDMNSFIRAFPNKNKGWIFPLKNSVIKDTGNVCGWMVRELFLEVDDGKG
jgi:hypothetical protein